MNNQLQYISQGNTVEEQVYNIHNGCDWIQMRFKKIIQMMFLLYGSRKKC
jgi:hypothetical protein